MNAATVALVGNPNSGKTSLFNALTGARQKIANYPGVTVEKKKGDLLLPDGRAVGLVDLPGIYGLEAQSPDEQVACAVLQGTREDVPDLIVAVIDATNLRNHLRFVLELMQLGRPLVVALNMFDLAERDGLRLDCAILSDELGVPVIPIVAVRGRGLGDLRAAIAHMLADPLAARPPVAPGSNVAALQNKARDIARKATLAIGVGRQITSHIDRWALHPVIGPILLALILFLMFQAMFSWAAAPMAWIEDAITLAQGGVAAFVPAGWLRSLINDAILSGVGSVLVFLPQILFLFAFIILLEQSGYMVRAAFLMDRMMSRVGLNGRAFIPLLSSFACAIPGIMATRVISDSRDRLITMLIAPLMTCSARLPVYTMIIAAFIPAHAIGGLVGLQGLVLFSLYCFGVLGAVVAALFLRRFVVCEDKPSLFLMEMPRYRLPTLRDVIIGLLQRAQLFLKRAGTIILGVNIVLWAAVSWPTTPPDSAIPQSQYSIAGRIGTSIEPLLRPIGFNREIAIALVPGLAAREVAVAALGTVYAIDAPDDAGVERSLVQKLQHAWPLPTALAFLAWYVFAPQCLSTLAVARRETNSWRWPLFMLLYLFVMAYGAAGLTWHVARLFLPH